MRASGQKLQTPQLTNESSLKTLVENRTVHTLNYCELNLFETYQESHLVPLKFNDLVVTSMLRGKKVMHLLDDPEFDYFPGATVMVPSQVEMKIDFPEASFENPTQCLALAIDHQKIEETLHFLNERYPKEHSSDFWKLNHSDYFFYNNSEMASTINKLIHVCMGSNVTKDVLADIALQELLIHMIQLQSINAIDGVGFKDHSSLLNHIVKFIRDHINDRLTMTDLTNEACMSKTSFYRYFKRELGMSPNEFVLKERIKYAKSLLKNPQLQVNQVCFESGFDDCNYFIRAFKKIEGITPKQFQQCQSINPLGI
jgi:AraC-like DNA-binding protein